MNRNASILLVSIALASVALGGCVSRAVKEGFSGVTGAKGVGVPIRRLAPLGPIAELKLGPVSDDTGGNYPRAFMSKLPGMFAKQLAEAELRMSPSGRKLRFEGVLIHYETADVAGQLFGPLEEAIVRVRLIDADSGQVLGVANCVGRSTTTTRMGPDNKADGVAKAMIAWVRDSQVASE